MGMISKSVNLRIGCFARCLNALCILFILFSLSACQEQEDKPKQIDRATNLVEDNLNKIKKNIKIGLPKKEVITFLGTKYNEVTRIEGSSKQYVYRYDLIAEKNYTYTQKLDEVDLKGIMSGRVKIVLFIDWDNQSKVNDYVIYYLENKTITEYRVFEDGTVRVSMI